MNSRQEIEELIERYSTGNLGADELRIFEKWVENDESMARAVEQHKILLQAFDVFAERSALQEKLVAIHDEIETEEFRYRSPLRKVDNPKTSVSRIRYLWTYHRTATVAAVMIFTAISAILTGYGLSDLTNNKQQSAFQELRREVESIKRTQRALNTTAGVKEAEPVMPVFTGTGFVLSRDGYVLTSYHVVQDARSIVLTNDRFQQLTAETVYADKALDLALLKINSSDFIGFSDIPYSFRKSIADPGEKVFTLGFPREDLVFGEGSISSYTGYENDTISYQVSIPVNPGNSGGPLFDNQGNLLGIISGRNSGADAAGFAVKSRWIAEYLQAQHDSAAITFPNKHNLRGLERPAQIKKLRDYVFMVKVTN
jgi:S1-C subfamily serine protease